LDTSENMLHAKCGTNLSSKIC